MPTDHSGTFGFFDGVDARNNVTQFMVEHAERRPHKKALMWVPAGEATKAGGAITSKLPHESIDFGAFHDAVNRISAGLKAIGVNKGDRVILFLPMSPQLYQAMSAILKIGAIAVFLDSWARRGHLGSSARTVTPRAMISFEGAFSYCSEVPELDAIPLKIVSGPHTGRYTATFGSLLGYAPDRDIEPVRSNDTALITFTTGSSGTPKGADRTHQFLAAQHNAIDQVIPYGPDDVDLPFFPIFSLNNIAAGVTTVIPCMDIGRPAPDDAVKLASQILSCHVNCATLSISMITGLVAHAKNTPLLLSSMKRVVTGGAPVSNDLLKELLKVVPKAKVMLLYGSTEVEPMAHIEAQEILFPRHAKSHDDGKVEQGVNVGFFAEALETKFVRIHKGRIILEEDDWAPWEMTEGEVGELLVSGLHVCKRYYNNVEATQETKVYESTGKVWHRTGDLARQDRHGQVWLVGRVHNTIVRNGKTLFPVRVEIALKRIDAIEKAAYVGVPDPLQGEKAYVVVTPAKPFLHGEKAQCMAAITQVLESYKVPADGIIVTDTIPMDPRHHSKVEYPILRDRIMTGEIS